MNKRQTPGEQWPIWGYGRCMLATAGNIQPPSIHPVWALKKLGIETLWDSQVAFSPLSTCLPALVITPHVNRTLSWEVYRLGVAIQIINIHSQVEFNDLVFENRREIQSKFLPFLDTEHFPIKTQILAIQEGNFISTKTNPNKRKGGFS